jgi:hypothetical protein
MKLWFAYEQGPALTGKAPGVSTGASNHQILIG